MKYRNRDEHEMNRMKGIAAILGVAVLMAVVGACGSAAAPTSLSDGVPTLDYASLVARFRAAGASFYPADKVSRPFFAPRGQVLTVNGNEDVQVFEFSSEVEADAVAETVSVDGSSVGTSMISWARPPHFYKAGRLIVVYEGSDSGVVNILQEIMGPQFAGM